MSGRVQGVWYRQSCADVARAAGVCGWVRNLSDGRVEAVFEGGAESVDRMVAWCRVGPPRASVVGVEVAREQAEGLGGFAVR
ncbi:MAG TPA: acylphosphatase [Acidimicrobiales bacterium]|nr:acylphosphatase [Acidimicrobiales bacterium]